MRKIALVALIVSLAGLNACSKRADPELVRDIKGPRFPNDSGVVTDVNLQRVELDGKRSYIVSRSTESFSTYDKKIVIPLLSWKSKFVHIGLSENNVVWIAGIGVVDTTVDPPVVHYTSGVLVRIDSKGNAILKDGTVFRLAPGVVAPKAGSTIRADIDPETKMAVQMSVL